MSHEWPDYEKEANAKARARRRGENYVVGEDDEDMKNQEYRSQKRKQNGKSPSFILLVRFLWKLIVSIHPFFSWFIVPGRGMHFF